MKTIYALALSMLVSTLGFSQNFEWAQLIDFPNANEVAAMDVNSSGHVYLTGVYGEGFSLPYLGESYIIKTDGDGAQLWVKYLGSEIIIGDLVCIGEDVVVVGHSFDVIQCDGAVQVDSFDGSSMFMVKINSDGTIGWLKNYPNHYGQFAHLDYDDGIIALQCSGAFNSGNHIMHFDTDGNEINDLEIDDYIINEIAYYNGFTYVTGGTSFGQGVQIGSVDIPAPATESLSFVLAFDESYSAVWGHAGNTINSLDNQIVAGESGVYSYQSILIPDIFSFTSRVWKFDFNGTLLEEIAPPVYTNAVSLYPDLALSDCHLSLFVQNDFNFDNHELIIFNHDLEVLDEKQINGDSNLYSGQVATHENQIYISHVHTADLDFNGEVEIIDFLDDAIQYPYLAKVTVSETCGEVQVGDCEINNLIVEQHECINGEFMIDFEFFAENVSDSFYVSGNGMDYGSFVYGQNFYTVGSFIGDGTSVYELVITDSENENCSGFIEFGAQECPVGDCFIDDLEVFDMECDTDSTYSMTFNVEIVDPGNEFIDVWVNNEFWDFYEIAALPITITGIIPRESDYDIIQICVNDNEFCCVVLEYMVPDCIDDGACSISELEVFDMECDTDSTYSMTFNADVINGPSDFIEVSVNNDFLGVFDISELPITVSGITPRDAEEDIIMICAGDLDACCTAIEYVAPDCLIDNIQEVEQEFSIYPNPVSETLFIQSDSSLINPRVIIYDSVGREVLVHSGINSQLSVSMLASGVYQLAIFEGENRVLITEIIKR